MQRRELMTLLGGIAFAQTANAQDKPNPTPPTIAQTIARYAVTLKFEDLPPEVVSTATRTILDTIGCAIGGSTAGPSQIAIKLASETTSTHPASVLCTTIKTSPDLAAFANGVMIRTLDFNDGYVSATHSPGHPSDTLAALLTAAEISGSSGRDLIVASVLANEVFCKVLDGLEAVSLGVDHTTITGLAAAVGAARLMGLSEQQITDVIGITIAGNTAIHQGRVGTLSNWKAFAAADACRKAIFAIQLVQNGMTGPSDVFEGRDGFFNVIARKPFALAPFGAPYGIMHAFTKRYPLGEFAQTTAQAAVEARAFAPIPDDIKEITIQVSHAAIKVMADGPDKWHPQTHETADHSIPYAAGLALLYGNVETKYYDAPYLHDPHLLELVSRIKCIPSDEADRREKEFNLCILEVTLVSGARKTIRVEYHRGHWKNPMTSTEMDEKFRSLTREHLSLAQTDALLHQLWSLETLPQAGALLAMTQA